MDSLSTRGEGIPMARLMTGISVDWMTRRDMADVLAIEGDSYSDPWDEHEFLAWLRERNCIGAVAKQGYNVVGYMLYELYPKNVHLLNLTVDPGFRRRGIGTTLINKLKTKLSAHRRTRLTYAVYEEHLAAQLFLRSQGFLAVRVLRGYYDGDAAAYLMRYKIGGEQ